MIIEKLKALGLPVLSGDAIGADYCHDEYPGKSASPLAVVEAAETEDVSAVLKLCSEEAVPLTVRGAGTGQVGGSVPLKGGIVLSLRGMNKILDYDEAGSVLRLQPGVLLQDVKQFADEKGKYYPPDPGEQTATIGGNAATNASGPCALKYGKTRDYIEDAVFVLWDGEIKKLSENSEYGAIIGSEGTLGVITELSLKLIEKPKADAILLLPFADTEAAVDAAKLLLAEGFNLSSLEYMDTDIIEFSGKITGNPVFPVEMDGERTAATLMLTIEDEDDDALMEKMESVAELMEEGKLECLDILVGDSLSMKRDFWAAHSAFHTSIESGAGCSEEMNISVDIDNAAEMISYAKSRAEELGVKALIVSHLASGGMHIHGVSDMDKEAFSAVMDSLRADIYNKCLELNGNVAGVYGIGYVKNSYLSESFRSEYKKSKEVLDPKGILNPGKFID